MGQGHDQSCFVMKNARQLAKKFLKTFSSLKNAWIFRKIYEFLERRLFFKDYFHVASLVLGLGFEHSCLWPREGLSLEGLSLTLPRIFLCPWPWTRALCPKLYLSAKSYWSHRQLRLFTFRSGFSPWFDLIQYKILSPNNFCNKVNTVNSEFTFCFFFLFPSSLPAFSWGLLGQQLEIKPRHFTVVHHIHDPSFYLGKVPSLSIQDPQYVIGPSSFRWCFPICFSK